MTQATEKAKNCKIEGCKRPYRAKGLCNVHYTKWRRGEMEKAGRYRTCANEGCKKPTFKKGYCEEHYSAWSASKKPQVPAEAAPAPAAAEAPKAEAPAAETTAE
jgi:hypothetical protein